MKVFISVDIEGITTTSNWKECDPDHPSYHAHADQMTAEVLAVCEGALAAGAKDICVRDAHGLGFNINQMKLPKEVILVRGWSGCPKSMAEGIDESFDAAMFVGYHAATMRPGNPLSHTISGSNIGKIIMNGKVASEFMIYSWCAAYYGVPTVFLSGDKMLCEDDKDLHPSVVYVAVKDGKGEVTYNRSTLLTLPELRTKSEQSLKQDLSKARIKLPEKFEVTVFYKDHKYAEKMSHFPDVYRIDSNTLGFERTDYYEVLRTLNWLV